jgi:hypothetical protein
VAKEKKGKENKSVTASALRLSFQTDRPLFPYREPDYKSAVEMLEAKQRLLRIYFIAEARYKGELTKESPWTGKVAWANKISADNRKKTLELLKLPENTTGPAQWWLTEFEDNWPYKVAPADVYFSRDKDQGTVRRETIYTSKTSRWPTDVMAYALVAAMVMPPILRRRARRSKERHHIE